MAILLDCGWTDDFREDDLTELAAVAKKVSCVLISSGDMEHAGALPYACAKLGLTAPIYATPPTKKLGHTLM